MPSGIIHHSASRSLISISGASLGGNSE